MKTDEFAGEVAVNRYDGGTFIKALAKQNDYLVQFGYYLAAHKIQPFGKIEEQKFSVTSNPSKNVRRFAAGLNYYVSGQNFKITGQYTRITPRNHAIHSTNEVTVQLQAWYY